MSWFDEKDDERTIKNHLSDKHCPDSIKQDARREMKERGYSKEKIREIEWNEEKIW